MSAAPRDYRPLIERFTAACEADERVVAAFLAGSLAGGMADAWSDIDLCLITREEDRDRFWAEREAFLRTIGEPLLVETFDSEVTVHFIFADGTEGELSVGSVDRWQEVHGGPFLPLVDKTGILGGATFPPHVVDAEDQREVLRRELMWFWHDLSHAIVAIGRGHLWWALGQLEVLRGNCINLMRLDRDYASWAEGSDKVDVALPPDRLSRLAGSVVPLEREAILAGIESLVALYRQLAPALAERQGIRYPAELDAIFADRLATLRATLESEGAPTR